MSVDNWYIQFVAADIKGRNEMISRKTKPELIKLCKYFRLRSDGNTIDMKNRLAREVKRLPI